MPEPDRTVDNSTIWAPDFSREHYLDLLFDEAPGANSMRNYFIEQSSNRYTVYGDVTDWIPVPGDAASYDDDFASPLGGNQVWYFLKDSVNGWYAAQIAAGKTPSQIDAYLASSTSGTATTTTATATSTSRTATSTRSSPCMQARARRLLAGLRRLGHLEPQLVRVLR